MAADYRSNEASGCSPSDAYRVSAKSRPRALVRGWFNPPDNREGAEAMLDLEPIADVSSQVNERGTRPGAVAVRSDSAADSRSDRISGHLRAYTLLGAMAAGLLVSACATTTSTPTPSTGTTAAATPTSVFASGAAKSTAVRQSAQVLGAGTYPSYTVAVPSGWVNMGEFVVKGDPNEPGPVLGLSVWNVGVVYRDPCHWHASGFVPKPGVDDLVAALVAQKLRNATTPTDVTLDGYTGKYLELSVPADMKSSTWTDFDACDIAADGTDRDFAGWLGNGGEGERYEQVPGQVDQLWVLNVNGQRLLVDATYSPDTSQADRAQLDQVVSSLQFSIH
jgi:hypothetical protein